MAVEEKRLAVAVHWRQAPDHASAKALVRRHIDEVATSTGLQREPGRLVEELRPPVREDKGTALRRVMQELSLERVVYLGDDRGDLPAFSAARELGGHAVVVHSPEMAPEVAAAPGLVLRSSAEVGPFLRLLQQAIAK